MTDYRETLAECAPLDVKLAESILTNVAADILNDDSRREDALAEYLSYPAALRDLNSIYALAMQDQCEAGRRLARFFFNAARHYGWYECSAEVQALTPEPRIGNLRAVEDIRQRSSVIAAMHKQPVVS